MIARSWEPISGFQGDVLEMKGTYRGSRRPVAPNDRDSGHAADPDD
jgi:hypothetical protein